MNRFQGFFLLTYLGVLFFCIFARIESWPFSDYRVFAYHNHPEHISLYTPFFKLSNGEYFNPGTREFYLHIDRAYFTLSFKKMDPPTLEQYLTSTAKSKQVRRLVKKMRREGALQPVKFVPMKTTFKKDKNNKWRPVYSPFKEYDIPFVN